MSKKDNNLTAEEIQKIEEFAQKININIKDPALFKECLTHRSYLNEIQAQASNNERLEFLGDAVLELVSTEYLFNKYPTHPEGDLTSFRAALVRTESLAEESSRMGVGEYIYMSKGEERTGGRNRPYILANTFESIVGAIYIDSGYDSCKKFITEQLLHKTDNIVKNRLDIDPKSKLQEIAQEILKSTPTYELIEATGPDHNKKFIMAVYIGGNQFGTGKGRSKQDAEQKAAKYTLENWDNLYKKYQNSGKISPN